jgi:hypothetical protein
MPTKSARQPRSALTRSDKDLVIASLEASLENMKGETSPLGKKLAKEFRSIVRKLRA